MQEATSLVTSWIAQGHVYSGNSSKRRIQRQNQSSLSRIEGGRKEKILQTLVSNKL